MIWLPLKVRRSLIQDQEKLNVDEYVNNATDSEASTDSYDIYIRVKLNSPNSDENPVWGVVNMNIKKIYSKPIGVVNRNLLMDTSKYEVQYMDGLL